MKKFFNGLMIWGFLSGSLMFWGVRDIYAATYHHGGGYVSYEKPDRTAWESQANYRRNKLAEGIMLIVTGLVIWVSICPKLPENPNTQSEVFKEPI